MERKRTFLHDAIEIASMGSHALESDDFTNCFLPNTLPNRKLTASRVISIAIRYLVLLPLRLGFAFAGFCLISVAFVFGEYYQIDCLVNKTFFAFMRLFLIALNIRLRHFGKKERLREPSVYVSNHTSFIDFVVLSSHKFPHACVAEHHGGLFGFIFDFIISKNGSISFKRSEKQDKLSVISKIQNHIRRNKAPMLIFPEGTCVNNKYTLLFQKGAFELNATVCPVAISYRKTLLDPYWNRRKHGFVGHLIYLITRWRIDADVYWMDPVRKFEGENPIEFAHRVKKLISDKIYLKNKAWNGYFKSQPMHADGDIFRQSFKTVYRQIKSNKLNNPAFEDSADKLQFLDYYGNEEGTPCKKYFGKLAYESFTNECCKEYLRIKSLSHEDRDVLINSEAYNNYTIPMRRRGLKMVNCKCIHKHA